ncbi:transposase, mutator-like family protein [Leptospira mayottensis 200901122]|uniref:Mutator family transposase n=1 Tax=Leptospira mayottensis 200901122 TaxID=1193010 RepID=A0AA87MMK0_9LEPT|nr:transposase, mutator-like family protein [Leptospira mayottensis 200901122]
MSNPKNRAEELLDELIKDKSPEDLLGNEGLLKQLTKSLIERAMQGEMTHHLGYEKNSSLGNNTGNSRNGKSNKKLKGDFETIDLEIPRDRNGSFEPQIIQKGQTRFTGFDDKIIFDVFTRNDHTRNYPTSPRNLSSGSLSGSDLRSHRFGNDHGDRVAESPLG